MDKNKIEEVINSKIVYSKNEKEDAGKIALVFGIATIVFGIMGLGARDARYISYLCAIIAIIFGIIGRKRQNNGIAIVGFVLGIIYLTLRLVSFIGGLFLLAKIKSVY